MKKNILIKFNGDETCPNREEFLSATRFLMGYGYQIPDYENPEKWVAECLKDSFWELVGVEEGNRGDKNYIDASFVGNSDKNLKKFMWSDMEGILDFLEETSVKTVQLNAQYTAMVHKDGTVEVGCQKFDKQTMEKLFEAWEKIQNK